jgi:hypothetical protein
VSLEAMHGEGDIGELMQIQTSAQSGLRKDGETKLANRETLNMKQNRNKKLAHMHNQPRWRLAGAAGPTLTVVACPNSRQRDLDNKNLTMQYYYLEAFFLTLPDSTSPIASSKPVHICDFPRTRLAPLLSPNRLSTTFSKVRHR